VGGKYQRHCRPLLAAFARRWAGGLLTCCAILVVGFGALFAHHTKGNWFDHAVDSSVINWLGSHGDLKLWLAAPGTLIPAGVVMAVIVVTCIFTGRLNGAVLAAAALPVSVGLGEGLLKPLVHRTYFGQVVYPSGHTTAVFAVAATVTVLLLNPQPATQGPLRGALIPTAACVLGCVVAVGVISLRFHYFTDTLAGAAVGIGTVCGLALILDLPAVRRWLGWSSRQRPVSQGMTPG
jgi:membrane-associated phospholipid phosphatase